METPPEGLVLANNPLYLLFDEENLPKELWADLDNYGYVRLALHSDIMTGTTTTNTSTTPLNLAGRGYYNYIGAVDGQFNLPPAVSSQGMFYRIYNKASNGTSALNVVADGDDQLFRGGTLLDNIVLDYGETITLVCDGIDYNVYN